MKVAATIVASRRDRLAESIATEGYVPLGTLCRKLGVSIATARRDLAHLQSSGRISRVRGGALPRHKRDAGEPDTSSRRGIALHSASESIASLFKSPGVHALKEAICDVGRRAWRRGLIDGASGHFSARVGEFFLCIPAGVSRGFLRPEMLCLVDATGNQIASHDHWKRSPEVLADLAIYRAVPAAVAVAHAHPPHATALSASDVELPHGLLPEFEFFAGPLARADFRMPGSPELANLVGALAPNHRSILLRNHGVVCWGTNVEDAYLKLEMTEAYCQTLAIATQMPVPPTLIPPGDIAALLEMKDRLGIPDPRLAD
ncbi:MAG TPA: class II aldolase/adducin family protein [Opitutaceae bacterium]|nr:class II aldolase/adducin family protein [Opitutaceae bacterium]